MTSLSIRAMALAMSCAAGCLLAAPAAEAKVTISITVNIGNWHGPGFYDGQWRDKLTCGEGRRLLRQRGYSNVQSLECQGRYYLYRASSRHGQVIIELNARAGKVRRVMGDGLSKPM
jgi:hypothetical protein